MINLIRSDLYEMRHSRSFFLCIIIAALVSVICIASTSLVRLVYADVHSGAIDPDSIVVDDSDDFVSAFTKGFYIGVTGAKETVADLGNDQVMSFYNKASNGTLTSLDAMKYSFGDGVTFPMILSIFISIYVGGEFTKKTIYNKLSKGYSRRAVYASKLIVSGLAAALITLITALVYGIISIAVLGTTDVTEAQVYDFIATLFCAIAVNVSFSSLYVMITVLLRNSTAAVAVNVGFISTLSISLSLVDMMSGYTMKNAKFWLGGLLSEIQLYEISPELVANVLLLSVVYITLTTLLGLYAINKRDV